MKPRDGPPADDGETTMARLNLQPTLIGRKPTYRLYPVLGDGKAAI